MEGEPCLQLFVCGGSPGSPGAQCSPSMGRSVGLYHFTGWEEGGTDEICQPTPQMPLSYPAPAPLSRQEGGFLEGTSTVRAPVPPRQSCPPHQSGDIQTCLSSCLAAEDDPRGDGQSCSEFNIGYTRFPLLESLYLCTPAPLDNSTSSPQGSSEAEPYCISPLQAGSGSPAL